MNHEGGFNMEAIRWQGGFHLHRPRVVPSISVISFKDVTQSIEVVSATSRDIADRKEKVRMT
jgi:hypothetical protein